jgi:hypothetical protein
MNHVCCRVSESKNDIYHSQIFDPLLQKESAIENITNLVGHLDSLVAKRTRQAGFVFSSGGSTPEDTSIFLCSSSSLCFSQSHFDSPVAKRTRLTWKLGPGCRPLRSWSLKLFLRVPKARLFLPIMGVLAPTEQHEKVRRLQTWN